MRDLLQRTGEALFGPHFQVELARAIGVNERTMRRWLAGQLEAPPGIKAELAELESKRKAELSALLKDLS